VFGDRVESIGADKIMLKSGITINCHAASFRSIRGRTLFVAIFDEVAFWRWDESRNPDVESYRAGSFEIVGNKNPDCQCGVSALRGIPRAHHPADSGLYCRAVLAKGLSFGGDIHSRRLSSVDSVDTPRQ
jgi:hypothetical protein